MPRPRGLQGPRSSQPCGPLAAGRQSYAIYSEVIDSLFLVAAPYPSRYRFTSAPPVVSSGTGPLARMLDRRTRLRMPWRRRADPDCRPAFGSRRSRVMPRETAIDRRGGRLGARCDPGDASGAGICHSRHWVCSRSTYRAVYAVSLRPLCGGAMSLCSRRIWRPWQIRSVSKVPILAGPMARMRSNVRCSDERTMERGVAAS